MSLAHPASCLGVSTALVLHTSEIRSTTTPMRVGQRDPAAGPAGSASEGPARSELSDAALPVASTAQAPPVVSTDLPPCFIHAREMLEEMHEIGFVIVPQLSPAVACEALKEAMKTRARYALQLMGHDLAEDCSGLLRIGKESDKSPPAAVAVQEHTCRAVAFFHNVDPQTLTRQPEKCSIKPPGSPVLPPHLDTERRGTFQVTPGTPQNT